MVSWYYRLMGVRVGAGTWLPSDLEVDNYDTLIIGDGVTIGGGCGIGAWQPPAGMEV